MSCGVKKKVLYLLHNRLPHNTGGYATRSHGLISGLVNYGWDINGVSRLGYPWDKNPNLDSLEIDEIDGIAYHRLTKDGIGLGKLPLKEYLEEYALKLLEFAQFCESQGKKFQINSLVPEPAISRSNQTCSPPTTW